MPGSESWLHAVFTSPGDVRDALEQLAEAGVAANDIEVRSSGGWVDTATVGVQPATGSDALRCGPFRLDREPPRLALSSDW